MSEKILNLAFTTRYSPGRRTEEIAPVIQREIEAYAAALRSELAQAKERIADLEKSYKHVIRKCSEHAESAEAEVTTLREALQWAIYYFADGLTCGDEDSAPPKPPEHGCDFFKGHSSCQFCEKWANAVELISDRALAAHPKPAEELCGEVVCHLIAGASWFPCGLTKGHKEEGHRAAGSCFKHGDYLGEVGVPPKCPKWPDCVPNFPNVAAHHKEDSNETSRNAIRKE